MLRKWAWFELSGIWDARCEKEETRAVESSMRVPKMSKEMILKEVRGAGGRVGVGIGGRSDIVDVDGSDGITGCGTRGGWRSLGWGGGEYMLVPVLEAQVKVGGCGKQVFLMGMFSKVAKCGLARLILGHSYVSLTSFHSQIRFPSL